MNKKGEIKEYLETIFIILFIILALYLLYSFVSGRVVKIV